MDKYILRAAWLYYNDERERWLLAVMDDEMLRAKLYMLPPDTDPAEGYETGRYSERTANANEPCCPQYKGRCLCSIDVSRHSIPPVW